MADGVRQPHQASSTPDWAKPLTAIAFDCFGTIADFADPHYEAVFGEICASHGVSVSGKDLWDHWTEQGRRLWAERGRDPKDPLAGPEPQFFTYREAWAVQFERSFAALGVAGDAARACDHLLTRLGAADHYPEAPEVLSALRGTYHVALMSNADDDFLVSFLDRSGLQFETIVSSEGVRSYKPRATIFRHLCDKLGLAPQQVLYVGDTPIADLLGARAAGLPVAWINRKAATLPDRVPPPDIEIRDLRQLLDVLPLLALPETRSERAV